MVLWTIIKFHIVVVATLVALAYIPGLLDIEPHFYAPQQPPEFKHSLQANNKLDFVEKLYDQRVEGPESIAFHKGELYTGLHGGRVVKLVNNEIVLVAKLGKPSSAPWKEHVTGKPLGMRFDKTGHLFVADAYYGVFKINPTSGAVEKLYDSATPVNGKPSKVTNDLDIASNGDIYFSDSSTKWPLTHGAYEMFESAPNGRLLKYDAKTKQTSLVLDNLHFANGVQLSPKEDYVIVAESTRFRVMRLWLKGPKKGQSEIFVDNLPGVPDNIRMSSGGGYWISLCTARVPYFINPYEQTLPYPIVRKIAARLIHVAQLVLSGVNALYPYESIEYMSYKLTSFVYLTKMSVDYSIVVEVNTDGDVIRSLHSNKGNFKSISQVTEHDGHLYLGSPWAPFLGKVKA